MLRLQTQSTMDSIGTNLGIVETFSEDHDFVPDFLSLDIEEPDSKKQLSED